MVVDPDKPGSDMAIVVGRGLLPRELVDGLQRKGEHPLLIGIEGETETWLKDHRHITFPWGKLGAFFRCLKRHQVKRVVLAGGVTRPKVELSKMDIGALIVLPQILSFMIGGDNSLLTGLIKLFNRKGMEIVGAHEVMPELLTPAGSIVGSYPSKISVRNMSKAHEASKALGALDIGQAAVAVGGRVVAVEGIEGTDGMLRRVAEMRKSGKLTERGRHGVLVKAMKPDQDMRVDLPAIGPQTIKLAAEAGLKGVAVEAGRSFILGREETLDAARKAGIFLFGLSGDEEPTDK